MDTITDIPQSPANVTISLADAAVREPIHLTAEVLRTMPVVVMRLDGEGRFEELLGASQFRFGDKVGNLIGRKAADEFPQMRSSIERALAGESRRFDFHGFTGKKPWAFDMLLTFDSNRGSGAVGFAIDVTKHQRAEECVEKHRSELAHIDRVRTVEQMASGIAHELNQPLAAIVVRADVASQKIKLGKHQSDEQLIESLGHISEQAYRAGCIIQRMKEFVKKTEPHHSSVDMDSVIREVMALVENDLRLKAIQLTTNIDAALPKILADRIQVQQVLLNVILNAVDAIDGEKSTQSQPREISLRVRAAQGVVETIVCDSGCGITDEHAAKCFETFYTTKREGMGMGLAISRAIVEAHGGHIWCKANEHRGTTFTFTMPIPGEKKQ